jgi:hypothetical protein
MGALAGLLRTWLTNLRLTYFTISEARVIVTTVTTTDREFTETLRLSQSVDKEAKTVNKRC